MTEQTMTLSSGTPMAAAAADLRWRTLAAWRPINQGFLGKILGRCWDTYRRIFVVKEARIWTNFGDLPGVVLMRIRFVFWLGGMCHVARGRTFGSCLPDSRELAWPVPFVFFIFLFFFSCIFCVNRFRRSINSNKLWKFCNLPSMILGH
jgi:hypothetical protein